jgi:signal peptide peptidase SppA
LLRKVNISVHLQGQAAADARKPREADTRGQTRVIELRGKLMKQQASMGGGTSTVRTRRLLRAAVADPAVSSILLYIDSPGGTVAGTRELANDVAAAANVKPVHAFIEDMGASAAYWIASQASRVSTNATGLVGSLGTYGVVHDYSAAAAMEGIKTFVVSTGKYKGAGVPGTEITPDVLADVQRNVDALNSYFVSAVATGRNMDDETVAELFDGRVHVGDEAKTLGLVDAVESLDEAFAVLQRSSAKGRVSMQSQETLVIDDTTTATPEDSQVVETPTEQVQPAAPAPVATTQTQPAQPAQPQGPQAASIEELRANCPGADDSFVLKQLESKADVATAMRNWMAEQQRLLAQPPQKATTPGVDAVTAEANETETSAGNGSDFWAKVEELTSKGVTKRVAISRVVQNHPELQQALIEDANLTRV